MKGKGLGTRRANPRTRGPLHKLRTGLISIVRIEKEGGKPTGRRSAFTMMIRARGGEYSRIWKGKRKTGGGRGFQNGFFP